MLSSARLPLWRLPTPGPLTPSCKLAGRVPQPPPSASNKDSQRVLIFTAANRSHKIAGNQDVED